MAQSPSHDPALPSGMIDAYQAQQAQQQATAMQRSAMLSGQINTEFTDILDQLRNFSLQMSNQQSSQANQASTTATGPTRSTTRVRGTSAPRATPAGSPGGARDVGDGVGGSGDDNPQTNQNQVDRVVDAYHGGRQQTMGGVARRVANSAARSASNRLAADGRPAQGPGGWRLNSELDPATGVPVYSRTDATGAIQTASVGDPGYLRARMSAATGGLRARAVSGLAEASAGEGGVVGALGTLGTKVAGPVGLAVGAALKVRSELENQNEDAAFYRSSFGREGTGMFAAKERWGEKKASFSGWGTIGGDRARDEYRQASSMGLRGQDRDNARDFSKDLYMKYGMDTDQSMAMVKQATEGGNISLKEYAKAIGEVSKSAVKAGRSSYEAVNDFNKVVKMSTKSIVGGQGAIGVAKSVENVTKGMDKATLAGIGGPEAVASLLTDQNVGGTAAMNGGSAAAAVGRLHNPDTAPGQAAKSLQQIGDRLVKAVANAMGMSESEMKKKVKRVTGGKAPSIDNAGGVFAEVVGGGSDDRVGQAWYIINAALRSLNWPVDPSVAYSLFIRTCLGEFKAEDGEAELSKSVEKRSKETGATKSSSKAVVGDLLSGKYKNSAAYQDKRVAQALGDSGAKADIKSKDPVSVYLANIKKTGQHDKVVEALLDRDNAKALKAGAGGKSAEETKIRVKAPNGQFKEMTIAEILRAGPSYISQLGSSDIVGAGGRTDTSVASVTGISSAQSKVLAAENKKDVKHTLDLSPWAKKVFQILSGDGGPSDAQRKGVPEDQKNFAGSFHFGGT